MLLPACQASNFVLQMKNATDGTYYPAYKISNSSTATGEQGAERGQAWAAGGIGRDNMKYNRTAPDAWTWQYRRPHGAPCGG